MSIQYFADAGVVRRVVEVAHNNDIGSRPEGMDRIAQRAQSPGGIEAVLLALFFTSVAGGKVADKDVEMVSGDYFSADMEDVTGLLVLVAAEADRMLRVSQIAEFVSLVEQRYVDAASVLAVSHAIAVLLPAERCLVQ